MIKLEQVTKDYITEKNVTHALRGINLEIEAGEFTAIVGTSGSGKSTLLHIIGGMDKLTSGTYRFQNQLISDYSINQLHRFRKENISFVFQHFALMNRYTVYENVEMPLLARGIKQRKSTVMKYLEYVKIEHLKNKKVTQLSGGEQQRCAIARALIAETPILLADEPTGALDQNTSSEIMDYFESIAKTGKTVVIITHDPNIAARCNRIVRVEDGKIESDVTKNHEPE